MIKKCLLLSGGLDSIALAYWLRPDAAITLNYGQVCAEAEVSAARKVCDELGIEHHVISINCSAIGSGDLLNAESSRFAPESDWWPFRNQLLITLAASKALELGVQEIILGSVKSDQYHSDGTIEFYNLISELLEYQEGGLRVSVPAIDLTAFELLDNAGAPASLLGIAHSCHKSNIPCSQCRGCYKHSSTMQYLLKNERR
ncbi:7-cyano-7-deazaguanine synthase [Thiomicrorhabdus sp. Kp2]|uniref:7-cyano-7-deazaguanine synthase n=1 Tax=Thiomicrorhabdus sp. Kp2 TaxID=1123518 RepID=UPI00040DF8BF|nr:7-cyano-7-deazaguanine synthase [Thiomicrorhabdus sp. Kp2]